MRAAARKATNRELRRAFGDEAVGTIGEMVATLNRQGQALIDLNAQTEKQREGLAALQTFANSAHQRADRLEAVTGRKFFGRLKWLLRGQ
jgi:hypothetical protein